jgi:hypothetical protein
VPASVFEVGCCREAGWNGLLTWGRCGGSIAGRTGFFGFSAAVGVCAVGGPLRF